MTVDNPWSPENWNLTEQGKYIAKYGLSVAQRKAKQAGTKIGALQKRTVSHSHSVIIRQKNVTQVTQIIQEGSRGYSGDGPPPEDT